MALCPQCGVDIEDAQRCPLCRRELRPEVPAVAGCAEPAVQSAAEPELTAGEERTRRIIITEVISVSMAMVAVSMTIINLILGGRLSWSLYILVSLAFGWLMVGWPLLFIKRPAMVLPVLCLAPFGFLFLLDWLSGSLSWFLPLALPIAAAVELGVGGVVLATRLSRRHGLNIVAYGLLAASGLCVVIELALCMYTGCGMRLVWSSVVAFASVPVAGFLIYFHHRISKTTTLRKLFHL